MINLSQRRGGGSVEDKREREREGGKEWQGGVWMQKKEIVQLGMRIFVLVDIVTGFHIITKHGYYRSKTTH